jgi:predicted dehydrogenase
MNKVELLIIGCGAIAEKAHLPALRRIPQAYVSALVDKNANRAQELKKKFHLKDALVFEDHLKALEEVNPDAVLILTPPSTHPQLIEEFAKAKIHIFCEKPIATNLRDARKLIQLISKPTKIMIGFSNRFLPQIIKMYELAKSGEIGTTIAMITLFSQDIGKWPSVSAYQFRKELGGGALFDSGMHYADLIRWFLGEVVSVESKVASYDKKYSSIDDFANIQLEFENGSIGTIYVLWCGPMMGEFFVMGDKGILKADSLSNNVQVFKKEFWILPPVEIKARQAISPYHSELLHFIKCIQNNKEVEVGVTEGIEALRIILAASRSAETGKKIFLKNFEG